MVTTIFSYTSRADSGSEAAAQPALRSPLSVNDHGVFILSLAGRKIGTEKFDIRSSEDKIEAKAEIQIRVEQDGNSVELKAFPDLVMNSQLQPLTYTWAQKGVKSSRLEIDFRKSPVKCRYRTVAGQEDDRDFDLPKDVVLLDDNVLHHYELVAGRLSRSAGGQQTFNAFIPQEALPGTLIVEEVGSGLPETGEHEDKLRHLRVTTELARIDIWLDKEQHLQRVSNPETQFKAVRKK